MASPFGDDAAAQVPTRKVQSVPVKTSPFGDEPAPTPEPSRMSKIGTGLLDVLQGAASGPRIGLEGLAGMGGDIYDLGFKGADWLAEKTGQPAFVRRGIAEEQAANPDASVPSSEQVRQQITNPILGESYKPTTKMGEIAQTVTSLLTPSTSRANVFRNVVAPAAGIEVGGEAGKYLGSESVGRLLGGFGGAAAPSAATRLISGGTLNPEKLRLLRGLEERGVDVTAGQASGRPGLKYAEAGPFNTKPAAIAERQGEQFNRAAMGEAGVAGDRMTPDNVLAARENFGAEYENLINQTGGLPLDHGMVGDLVTLVDRYHELKSLPSNAPTRINSYFRRISDAARDHGNVIPTDTFQQIRSEIAKDLRSLKDDPTQAQALRDFQDALYGSIGRNAPMGVEAQWRDLNTRYRDFKTLEKSMQGAGADTAEGMITPQKLRGAVQGRDPSGYLVEGGNLDTLAKAGENMLKPLPQSGTTPRAYLASTGAGVLGALLSGHPLAAAGALGGAAFAPAASAVVTSRPVQAALLQRMRGQQPLPINPETALRLVRQGQGQ